MSKNSLWEVGHLYTQKEIIFQRDILFFLVWVMSLYVLRRNLCDFMPQHSDSEGALAADRWPLQATASISTLGLCESSAEKPVAQDEYPPEALIPSDNEEPIRASPSLKPDWCQRMGWSRRGGKWLWRYLMEDNQVADFASSMLAAISCWHYRARALLSMDFTTVRFSATKGILSYPTWLHVCQTSRHVAVLSQNASIH